MVDIVSRQLTVPILNKGKIRMSKYLRTDGFRGKVENTLHIEATVSMFQQYDEIIKYCFDEENNWRTNYF